ncbi:hypothetical protein [Halobacillus sp. A5]|uniref:hypothetical protein n=1 Tax=Halobacillus sp. A5 TaxID=2880263 RepID=UPI0020A65AAE|nr:hypothetical protein [Halobacillus sp. A5]MCP3026461.1 hypothetical protein [Halobacillus sp. A5]
MSKRMVLLIVVFLAAFSMAGNFPLQSEVVTHDVTFSDDDRETEVSAVNFSSSSPLLVFKSVFLLPMKIRKIKVSAIHHSLNGASTSYIKDSSYYAVHFKNIQGDYL